MSQVLHPMLLAQALGGQPWAADSVERQQFALFMLTRVCLAAATLVHATLSDSAPASREQSEAAGVLLAAARQLREPPLRQLMEVAAPALVVDVDALSSGLGSALPGTGDGTCSPALLTPALDLLTALRDQLDPLALGLALPGCWNPACTSLAGASEADMKLKRCTSCKVAR